MTMGKISDSEMRHCHFLKSTCDIGDPTSRAPRYRDTADPTTTLHERIILFLENVLLEVRSVRRGTIGRLGACFLRRRRDP